MKKTCNNCKAKEEVTAYILFHHNHMGYKCSLGYKTKNIKHRLWDELAPDEDCPKPKTIKDLISILNETIGVER